MIIDEIEITDEMAKEIAEMNARTIPNALGEALAFSGHHGDWEPCEIERDSVLLANTKNEIALVSSASSEEIKWDVYRFPERKHKNMIKKQFSSLNEVLKFLNQDFESAKSESDVFTLEELLLMNRKTE